MSDNLSSSDSSLSNSSELDTNYVPDRTGNSDTSELIQPVTRSKTKCKFSNTIDSLLAINSEVKASVLKPIIKMAPTISTTLSLETVLKKVLEDTFCVHALLVICS